MLKRLAIFAMLGPFATVGILVAAKGAVLSTPKQGITEQNTGLNGNKQAQSQSSNQPTQNTTPALTLIPRSTQQPPAADHCDEACQEARENLAIQRKLATFTGWLIFVGSLQAIALILQALLLRKHSSHLDKLAGSAAENAKATQDTLKAIEEQASIARRSLIAQFRPKIVVRTIELVPFSVEEFDNRGDGIWEIEIHLVNKGDTVAHINVCSAEAYWESHYPAMTRAEIGKEDFGEFSMDPGEKKLLTIPIKQSDFRISMGVVEHVEKKGSKPYEWPVCLGYILYTDDNGCERETEFERSFDIKSRRFVASEDPEAEYSD